MEPTVEHYESDEKLIEIKNNPKKFQIGVLIALIEHFCVIILSIMLFLAFNSYNLILGLVLVIFRLGEGIIQAYLEIDYCKLLEISKKYTIPLDGKDNIIKTTYQTILQDKTHRFAYAMFCWSIGTLAFAIILISYDISPSFIGWIGIGASIPMGIGNLIKIKDKDNHLIANIISIFALLAILFEILIGAGLLFYAYS